MNEGQFSDHRICEAATTQGSSFIPSANHAGGLRYHGMSSVVSELYDQGILKARSVEQTSVFGAVALKVWQLFSCSPKGGQYY